MKKWPEPLESLAFAHQVWVAEDSDFPEFDCYDTDSLIRYGEFNAFSDGRHAGKTFLAVALECADYYVWLSHQPLDDDPPSQFTLSMCWWQVFTARAILLDLRPEPMEVRGGDCWLGQQ